MRRDEHEPGDPFHGLPTLDEPPQSTLLRPTKMGSKLVGSRLEHDEPLTALLTIPIALIVSMLFVATDFGRLVVTPISIQFHELGHAIVAILSGRFAIPIPCGITVWSLEPSTGMHIVVVLGAALLALRGARERLPLPLALAAGIVLAQLSMALFVDEDEKLILLAGGAAELLLPGLAIVSFYFRMPDRLRWDFFRFLVVPAGALAYAQGMYLWLSVLLGRIPAPMGTFLGSGGDGAGDLDRLIRDHGLALSSIVRGYVALGIVIGALIAAVYLFFALRAREELRRG